MSLMSTNVQVGFASTNSLVLSVSSTLALSMFTLSTASSLTLRSTIVIVSPYPICNPSLPNCIETLFSVTTNVFTKLRSLTSSIVSTALTISTTLCACAVPSTVAPVVPSAVVPVV